MDRDTFIKNTNNLIRENSQVRIAAEALECDIDCYGFIADLINNYGNLILKTAYGDKEPPDEAHEEFWNSLINMQALQDEVEKFYDKHIGGIN